MRRVLAVLLTLFTSLGHAAPAGFTFPSIDGGEITLSDWRGQPVPCREHGVALRIHIAI